MKTTISFAHSNIHYTEKEVSKILTLLSNEKSPNGQKKLGTLLNINSYDQYDGGAVLNNFLHF